MSYGLMRGRERQFHKDSISQQECHVWHAAPNSQKTSRIGRVREVFRKRVSRLIRKVRPVRKGKIQAPCHLPDSATRAADFWLAAIVPRWSHDGFRGLLCWRNGANTSMGTGRNVVVLCSLEISFIVWRKRNWRAIG